MLTPNTLMQDRYLIEAALKSGGMGTVYVARDQKFDMQVAIKETKFNDGTLASAFEREARLLARLRHPALPRVTDRFSEGDGRFLVMDYIPGEDLGTQLQHNDKEFPLEQVLRWCDQLLGVLEYLHQQNPPIIHRDIKPQNLKLNEDGRIILLDFGIAKGATMVSVDAATHAYAPLEQIQSKGTDARTDLYSLAVTLYQLATNILPPTATDRVEKALSGQSDPVKKLTELNPDVPESFAKALMHAMELFRNQRPDSAAQMRKTIREVSTATVSAKLSAQAGAFLPVASADVEAAVAPRKAISKNPSSGVMKDPIWRRRPWIGILAGVLIVACLFAVWLRFFRKGAAEVGPAPIVSKLFSNTASIQVPYSGTMGVAAPYPSTITVSDVQGMIVKTIVVIEGMTHSQMGDVRILLVGPDLQRVLLTAGGIKGRLSNARVVFDDDSPSEPDAPPVGSLSLKPIGGDERFPSLTASPASNQLGVFAGKNPNGSWALYVLDAVGSDSGQIRGGWSLKVEVR